MATSANRLDRYPVDEHGNLEHYPSSVHTWQGRVVDNGQLWSAGNEPFAAELTFVDGRRGRSAAVFEWRDAAGRVYPMFMTDLLDVLHHKVVERGVVRGVWQVRKRGQNYGLALAPGELPA
ncbi:hypothetical protein [Catellatospora bangladeshensis]|uniref:Uncharacterized protein n=1 Tax=Catellatospora bangladeshensis TaxID=310355 RepID=A0A8J3NHT2_9ACTN|nr:hypothetical protein [Catellatospora bangladeshensis]GIF80143.1 hypothetical protein Cba03nite_14920 [Catellatospora bangladeshensis]